MYAVQDYLPSSRCVHFTAPLTSSHDSSPHESILLLHALLSSFLSVVYLAAHGICAIKAGGTLHKTSGSIPCQRNVGMPGQKAGWSSKSDHSVEEEGESVGVSKCLGTYVRGWVGLAEWEEETGGIHHSGFYQIGVGRCGRQRCVSPSFLGLLASRRKREEEVGLPSFIAMILLHKMGADFGSILSLLLCGKARVDFGQNYDSGRNAIVKVDWANQSPVGARREHIRNARKNASTDR